MEVGRQSSSRCARLADGGAYANARGYGRQRSDQFGRASSIPAMAATSSIVSFCFYSWPESSAALAHFEISLGAAALQFAGFSWRTVAEGDTQNRRPGRMLLGVVDT